MLTQLIGGSWVYHHDLKVPGCEICCVTNVFVDLSGAERTLISGPAPKHDEDDFFVSANTVEVDRFIVKGVQGE